MSDAQRMAVPHGQTAATGWSRHLLLLAGAIASLLILFRGDVGDLAYIYWNSTTFGHCLFILPVFGWLVWQRREGLAQLTPQSWYPGLLLVAGGGGLWLLGSAAGVALLRHLGLVLMMQGAAVTLLGPHIARAILFPLAFLLFLVPFGEMFEAPLQTVTVHMCMVLLHLFGVPAQVDGVLITIPNGYFEVAEACSGAKFLIAMMAYGTLVANVCYVSWKRRAGFMAMALVVPIIANGIRAFGTIYAAHLTSVEAATGFDHIVYGWVFFALVMAMVLAIGWRWFDRDPDAPWFDPADLPPPARLRTDPFTATGLVIGIALAFLLWAGAIAGRADALPRAVALPELPGWTLVERRTHFPWAPHYPDADRLLIGQYRGPDGARVDLAVAIYAGQREGREVVGFGIGPIRENDQWVRIADEAPIRGGAVLRMTAPGPVYRHVATWYDVAGTLTDSPNRAKLATLRAKLLGGKQRAVAILISVEDGGKGDPRAEIGRFADALRLDTLADRMLGTTN
ncbi:exosortase A [Stakelama pacifica]|uniref:Exosortase A n=1 Tax=Stakelama pacifica TaxID=517720 RepID=A0A4R6FF75_9SPHN|nr:exosortase A [Stakelama pacifica]TDN79873.1 exosortase A [Stakelama pacifica]GGO98073.1 exosortase A [Stakelama pacifica]